MKNKTVILLLAAAGAAGLYWYHRQTQSDPASAAAAKTKTSSGPASGAASGSSSSLVDQIKALYASATGQPAKSATPGTDVLTDSTATTPTRRPLSPSAQRFQNLSSAAQNAAAAAHPHAVATLRAEIARSQRT